MRSIGATAVSTTEELARREGFEPSIVGLEGRLPVHRSAHLERANGVEPSHASLAKMPRTMRARVLVPRDGLEPPYVANRATVLPLNERGIDWSEWQDSNLHGHAPKARGQPLTHTLNVGDSCWSLTSLKRFCRPLPGCSANESKWGDGLGLHQLTGVSQTPAYLLRLPPQVGTLPRIRTGTDMLLRQVPLPLG